MNTQTKLFLFDPPINLDDEGKWLLAVPFFETTNSIFYITDEINSISIITPSHWSTENAEGTIIKLKIMLDLRSENDLDLQINEVNTRGNIIISDGQEYTNYNISDKSKYDIIEILKNKYDALEDLVYRLELTKKEIIDILDLKYIPLSTVGCTLPNGIYEIRDIDQSLLQSLLLNLCYSML